MRRSLISFCIISIILCPLAFAKQPDPSIEVTFSPKAGATEAIVRLIGEAKKSIRVAAYNFSSKDIAQALLEAHKRGIDVKVVLDKSNDTAKYSSATFLANVGIPTRINYRYAIMHNKFMVVDGITVETGSFNYTKAAEEKNAENVLILWNYPKVAQKYLTRWQKLWEESKEHKAKY